MEAHESFEHVEKAHAATEAHHRLARHAAAIVAALAALLAVASLAAGNASSATLLDQQKASDTYNELEANSLKRHIDENTSSLLRALPAPGQQSGIALSAARRLDSAATGKYQAAETRLLPVAQQYEHARDTSEAKDHDLHLAEVSLQIAIVLTSVAILASRPAMVWLGSALGTVGALLLANGLWSVVTLPT